MVKKENVHGISTYTFNRSNPLVAHTIESKKIKYGNDFTRGVPEMLAAVQWGSLSNIKLACEKRPSLMNHVNVLSLIHI